MPRTPRKEKEEGKRIELTHGKFALVDAEDFEEINKHHWWVHGCGYAYREVQWKPRIHELMHRVILKAPKGLLVDHINGDKLDNRRKNLRLCSRLQNTWNTNLSKNNTSGYKGVVYNKRMGKWIAQIKIHGKGTYLGSFSDPKEASEVYNKKSLEVHGEFAFIRSRTQLA